MRKTFSEPRPRCSSQNGRNANILTRLSGVPVPVNREPHALQPGNEALVMLLRYRVQGMKGGERFDIKDFEFGLLEYLKH